MQRRKTEQKKRYATIMLQQSLSKARKIGLKKVMLSCDADNYGSNKVIQNNKGVLEKKIKFQGKEICIYWIKL
jgi:predicted acetyltransferase